MNISKYKTIEAEKECKQFMKEISQAYYHCLSNGGISMENMAVYNHQMKEARELLGNIEFFVKEVLQ